MGQSWKDANCLSIYHLLSSTSKAKYCWTIISSFNFRLTESSSCKHLFVIQIKQDKDESPDLGLLRLYALCATNLLILYTCEEQDVYKTAIHSWHQIQTIFPFPFRWRFGKDLPSHFCVTSLNLCPAGHLHSKDPTVLMQFPPWQIPGMAWHSSTSIMQKTTI